MQAGWNTKLPSARSKAKDAKDSGPTQRIFVNVSSVAAGMQPEVVDEWTSASGGVWRLDYKDALVGELQKPVVATLATRRARSAELTSNCGTCCKTGLWIQKRRMLVPRIIWTGQVPPRCQRVRCRGALPSKLRPGHFRGAVLMLTPRLCARTERAQKLMPCVLCKRGHLEAGAAAYLALVLRFSSRNCC